MHRLLAGSDDSGQHTSTGLAEKHIQLIKVASLKTELSCKNQGLHIDKEDIVVESCGCQNTILEYGGFTPSQGAIGHNPRGLYELE